jgi:hypothetical protein
MFSNRRLAATLAIGGVLVVSETRALAQCVNINAPETVSWANSLIVSALGQDSGCRAGAPDRDTFATSTACNMFVGRVMARMYGLTTFVSEDHSFLKANDMAGRLPTWNDWIDLGTAGDQAALSAASDEAKLGYVVLAVWANPVRGKPGHVALVGPGPLTPSRSWGGLRTPVAASFTLDDVDSAFIGQPLACAFGGDKRTATHLWKYRRLASPR